MAAFIIQFLFIVCLIRATTAQTNSLRVCPLLGPDFPPPRNISQNPEFRNILSSFSNVIQQLSSPVSNSTYGPFDSTKNTFSINIFSTFSEAPLYEYHHTASLFKANSSIGTKSVDGDTIFRIGSISKLFTVFALLIEKGDAKFNDPITKYVPELKHFTGTPGPKQKGLGAVNAVQWDDVTVGALASQMSGIGRIYNSPGELAFLGPSLLLAEGLPPLNASDLPTCGVGIPGIPLCDRAAFFKGFLTRHPVFAPSTTPIYSNVAFQILAYALENMANNNKTFSSIVSDDILKPLHMARTSTSLPMNSSLGAIPGQITRSGWSDDLGDETPTGGIYSTSNDLAKLGRAILNSTLLSPAQTRRWMKPVTHTSSLKFSVGAPWEIIRVETSRGIIDFYTKSGGIGVYASLLVLAPDFDVGWVILSAADRLRTAGVGLRVLRNLIADTFIPALGAATKAEAAAVFAGTYKATVDGLNSSITIVTDDFPGLGVQSWVNKGKDVFKTYLAFSGLTDDDYSLSVRLYPTNLLQDSPKQQAFRGVFEILPNTVTSRNSSTAGFYSSCGSWSGVDGISYGNIALDDFLFRFDEFGRAVSVEPRILRVILEKEV